MTGKVNVGAFFLRIMDLDEFALFPAGFDQRPPFRLGYEISVEDFQPWQGIQRAQIGVLALRFIGVLPAGNTSSEIFYLLYVV